MYLRILKIDHDKKNLPFLVLNIIMLVILGW